MRQKTLLPIAILSLIVASCAQQENAEAELFDTTWTLEYMSGIRIAFEGLFPDRKPEITFDEGTGKVLGHSGCNGYSADFTVNQDEISFGEPGPTTMMYCGEGEGQFLNMMERINRFGFDDEGNLNLMIDDVPMMRFASTPIGGQGAETAEN
jgi:heat shock protein HslJ